MTYFLTTPRGAIKRYSGRPAMGSAGDGGWFDSLMNIVSPGFTAVAVQMQQAEEAVHAQCYDAANRDPKIKQIDDYAMTIAKTWTPTGFYSPEEISSTVGLLNGYLQAASTAVQQSPNPTSVSDRATTIAQAVSKINEQLAKGAAFTTAAAAGTDVINAPGFKRWVLNALEATSQAMVVRSVLECSLDALDRLLGFLDAVWRAVKAIGSLIVKAGETILQIPDAIGQVWTIVKWGAIIGGGAWLAFKIREASRHGPK